MTNREQLEHWMRLRGLPSILRTLSSIAKTESSKERFPQGANPGFARQHAAAKAHWNSVAYILDKLADDVHRQQARIYMSR